MPRKQNYSRKREAILTLLRGTKIHPSAEWVYQELKPQFPDLSLGTVYRNLSRFKEEGTIVSIGTVKGQERYDADISPHSHLICTRCGAVLDVTGDFVREGADALAAAQCEAKVESHSVLFYGLCRACVAQVEEKE